jgi:uncharacterized membrane protein
MRKEFLRSREGFVSMMFALMMPVFLMCAAISVDVGTFYLQKRALQGATDLAAIAAAANASNALTAAQQNLVLNGFSAAAVQSVTFGNYTANAALSPAQRFTPIATGTAVQVTTTIQARYYFATILNMISHTAASADSTTINAQATAALDQQAAIGIGSGLASLNNGVLNSLLGGLLGSNVSLSLMDYQSLANANINLFAFGNALAQRLNVTALTYNDVANLQAPASVVMQALSDAANQSSGVPLSVVDDLATLANLAPNTNISVGQLVAYGEDGVLQLNSAVPLTATTDALDMVSAVAQLANGTNQMQVALGASAYPVASATVALAIGQPPVNSGFVAVGPIGTTVHTAQTRLLITLQIAQTGSTSLINLPIYIELASATATLSSISCPANSSTQASAVLLVTPAVVSAWIGAVSSSNMTNFSTEPSPAPVTLVNLLGLGAITGSAHAQISNLTPTSVSFSPSDIANQVRHTTSTTDYVSSLLYSLFANLQLTVNIAGLNVQVPSAVSSALGATLATAVAPIDQVVSQVLTGLGISLGNAYTWVSGVQCGTPAITM